MKRKIGIIGQGFVGNAIYQKFKNYFDVYTYDKKSILSSELSLEHVVVKSDIVFLCLPTPMNSDGTCNLDIVESVLNEISSITQFSNKIIVIKSTIPPGTTDEFNIKFAPLTIVFNPEFLTEANAVSDFANPSKIIIGGPHKGTAVLKQIYRLVFPVTPIIKTGAKHAEMVKYLTNCFLATKVSFANEMSVLCEELGLDYDKVIEYATYDGRLGKSHWSVPGPDGDYGYGGQCFPKDLSVIIEKTKEVDSVNNVLQAVQKTNNEIRTNRDWEQMVGRAVMVENNG
jgi:nucleotide sugar dehydrogenase